MRCRRTRMCIKKRNDIKSRTCPFTCSPFHANHGKTQCRKSGRPLFILYRNISALKCLAFLNRDQCHVRADPCMTICPETPYNTSLPIHSIQHISGSSCIIRKQHVGYEVFVKDGCMPPGRTRKKATSLLQSSCFFGSRKLSCSV
jgi:hypothetical protein